MAARMGNMRICFHCRKLLFLGHLRSSTTVFSRSASDLTVNHKWQLDPAVENAFAQDASLKHRNHPGIVRRKKKIQLPQRLQDAISLLVDKYPTKDLEKRSKQLAQYIWSRHRPVESHELEHRAHRLEQDALGNYDSSSFVTEEEYRQAEADVKGKVIKRMRREVYHWKPVQYDAYKSFLYLVGRVAQDYSTLYQIFLEISNRDAHFKPESFFDFGSGVGSGLWAVNETWTDSVREHYCVDSSSDMYTIARLLLQGGEEQKSMILPGVYFRQFLPLSHEREYDLVVSAFSLLELPNQTERLNTLFSLWQKTKKYLVLVENGSNAGFQTILEARDFILQFGSNENIEQEKRESLSGHVFAPCPHDGACGRFARQDGTPCNFVASYRPMDLSGKADKKSDFRYSYVVLKKGPRADVISWPRIVREVSQASKRVHIRSCCPNGEMQMSVITAAKHGKHFYWCARACKWGDLLPAVPKESKDSQSVQSETDESNTDLTGNESNTDLTGNKSNADLTGNKSNADLTGTTERLLIEYTDVPKIL